ncbi:hypothetical protein MJO52_12960 [Microbulbifer variabilis]|uniref:DUF7673 domain-containing protein n=1 Tax=Microbulbifer variabilis TaxID=266805 RepID=A0ABY4VDF3_9GAMM|nr:hypothetical protein [Microbulbifer variabilis]USD19989.1 hypothetical protein MJO52_12960 [Microbulbifer variabilis]
MNTFSPTLSVETLLRVANGYSGASAIAAQVLLSAWNSNDFTVPVAELSLLDGENYQHALNVMTLRYQGKEPQNVIAQGDKKFHTLCVEWSHLETQRKGAA